MWRSLSIGCKRGDELRPQQRLEIVEEQRVPAASAGRASGAPIEPCEPLRPREPVPIARRRRHAATACRGAIAASDAGTRSASSAA